MTAPLTIAELAAALAAIGGFETRPQVAVAVSGGPDSMALVLLVARWAQQCGGRAWGLTVDHGLRPESAGEAHTVGGWLAARAIPHAILSWRGNKHVSGIQEAARKARYCLLAGWCRENGVLHLLTAHHREDQAETHLIRRRAGSGGDGLAAMSAVRELAGCRLVRPLLAVPRARLAALLAAEGQSFIRDPSNFDPAFERARLRLREAGGTGICRMAEMDEVCADVRAYGRRRIAREQALDRLAGRAVALHPAGFAVLDRALLAAEDGELTERLLARVAASIGGVHYPLRLARLARLRRALAEAPDRARTLGNCRFVPWRGRLLVLRELAAADPPLRLEPGACRLWDRRFAVSLAPDAAQAVVLDYLGRRGTVPKGCGDLALPRFLCAVLPAVWDENGLAAVPHLGYRRAGVGALPTLSLRPANGLTRAGFTVV